MKLGEPKAVESPKNQKQILQNGEAELRATCDTNKKAAKSKTKLYNTLAYRKGEKWKMSKN